MRRQKGIGLKNVSAAVIVHDHVHFCGLDQIGVNIKAKIVGRGHLGYFASEVLDGIVILILTLYAKSL